MTSLLAHIDHAGSIVSHMRDFIRRGRPHVSTVDARKMLEQALTLAHAEANSKQIRLDLEMPSSLPFIHGDNIQLEQVILNLVHNAVEAITNAKIPNGHIRVIARAEEAPPRIEFSVKDNGPGVEDRIADHLFDPLATSKKDGLGLGLSISASIVEAHGGRIWLQERSRGATEFRFSVPLESVRA